MKAAGGAKLGAAAASMTAAATAAMSVSKQLTFSIQIKLYHSFAIDNDFLDVFDFLLQQCTTVQQSKQLHTQLVATGAYRSAFLAARLVSIYAHFGLLFDAYNVFNATLIEGFSNLLLWNSILRANVSYGYYEDALKQYDRMRKMGVLADGFTFPLVIRACAFMGSSNLCKNLHNHVFQMGFQNHVHVVNELMGSYGKLGQMVDAQLLFDRMRLRSCISWNIMVSGFALNYNCDGALMMFQRMELEGLEPNLVTWTSLLSSHARCGRHGDVMQLFGKMRVRGIGTSAEVIAVVLSVCAVVVDRRGKIIHGYVIRGGFEEYLFVKNALICMYGKYADIRNAQSLFLETKNRNIVTWNALITSYAEAGLSDEAFAIFSQLKDSDSCLLERPNVISWSAVISGFASQGRGEESLELFRQMQLAKVMANSITISSVLSACAELAALALGKEIHAHVVRALMDINILVGNGLVNMYTKCGCLEEGRLIFEKIDKKDLISWNTMITGYGMHGHCENALATFNTMIKTGLMPDGVTFVAILSACSHAGLVAEGRKHFDMMIQDFRIEPQMEHYACMVDLLGRVGSLDEASNIIKNMPMKPNACVWGALLNSSRMHKNVDVAEGVASELFSLNNETTGSYMLLSNVYAASGRWEESARVRISAKTKGLKKIPGQSWVEVKNKVYMFTAGNTEQKGLEEVYQILEELALQMEINGCISKKRLSQQDCDEEEKKWILYG